MARIKTFKRISPLWEKLIGLYAGDWVREGFWTRDQIAHENTVHKFLSRYPWAESPEDITSLEVRDYWKTEIQRWNKAFVRQEFERLADFWAWLIWRQEWFVSNPFLELLQHSRWMPGAVSRKSRSAPANSASGSGSSGVGPPATQSPGP